MKLLHCRPRAAFRCWQYWPVKDQQEETPIPLWVAKLVNFSNEEVTWEDWTFDPGDWLVQFSGPPDPLHGAFTDAQFAARFDIVTASVPGADPTAQVLGETQEKP